MRRKAAPSKGDKEVDPQVWVTLFPHMLTLSMCGGTFFKVGGTSAREKI